MAQRKAHRWLTEHQTDLQGEARAAFTAFYDDLTDDEPYREQQLMGVALYLAGDLELGVVGTGLAKHRREVEECFAIARAVGPMAVASGEPESHVADALGVDRMTLRKWQGKR